MKVFNKHNSQNTGDLAILQSHLLISRNTIENTNISLQITSVPVDSKQPLHNHEPEQCYYIISGKGLMIIEQE